MVKWTALILAAMGTTLLGQAANDTGLPDGPGKAIVLRMCVGCHKTNVITAKHATKEQWSSIVQQMVSRGADGTDEEIAIVVNYLAASFPAVDAPATPPAPPSMAAVGYDSMLTLPQSEVDAMLRRWRSSSVPVKQRAITTAYGRD
jgi:hypothetical protein